MWCKINIIIIHQGVVSAIRFGIFGREDGTLVLVYKKQGIDVKMFGRKFNFEVNIL